MSQIHFETMFDLPGIYFGRNDHFTPIARFELFQALFDEIPFPSFLITHIHSVALLTLSLGACYGRNDHFAP